MKYANFMLIFSTFLLTFMGKLLNFQRKALFQVTMPMFNFPFIFAIAHPNLYAHFGYVWKTDRLFEFERGKEARKEWEGKIVWESEIVGRKKKISDSITNSFWHTTEKRHSSFFSFNISIKWETVWRSKRKKNAYRCQFSPYFFAPSSY